MKKLFEVGTFSIVDEDDIPPWHKNINFYMSFKIKDGDWNSGISRTLQRRQEAAGGRIIWRQIGAHIKIRSTRIVERALCG